MAQAAPDPQQQADTVEQAHRQLARWYVRPLDSAELFTAGWQALNAEAEFNAVTPAGPPPAFSSDPAADLALLRENLMAYVARQAEWPEGFVPAHAVIRGMVASVNEGHTYFMDPAQFQQHLAWLRGDVRYGGIGARLRGPMLTVLEVFKNTPAERAGLQPGDVIEAVDGLSLEGVPLDRTIGLVRGPAGSAVDLLVRRPEVGEPFTLTITREEIAVDFVSSRTLEGNVGYISLRGFPSPAIIDSFEAAMADFQAQQVKGLVLDLRGNSGGRIDVGERLLGHFLPEGANLYRQLTSRGETTVQAVPQAAFYDLPLAVLVDGATASMGEIFAAAVQANQAGRVIGSVTSGSVAAGQVFPLHDGSALQITVSELLAADGRVLNRVGLVPDEVVPPGPRDDSVAEDAVIQRGLAWVDSVAPITLTAAVTDILCTRV